MSKITLQSEKEMITISEIFDKFIYWKKINNLSDQSLTYYETCFRNFIDYLPPNTLGKEINADVVYNFIPFLRKRNENIKDVTINSYLRGLRVIFYFGMERGLIPNFKIHMIRADKELKEPYTDEDLALLLKKPNMNKSSFVEYQTWTMINYFLQLAKATFIVIEILNPIIRNSKKSTINTTSLSHS